MSQPVVPPTPRTTLTKDAFVRARTACDNINRMIADYLKKGGPTQLVIGAINADIRNADEALTAVSGNKNTTLTLVRLWSTFTQDHWKGGTGSWHDCQKDMVKIIAELDAILRRA
jgi:hypothetical protein